MTPKKLNGGKVICAARVVGE